MFGKTRLEPVLNRLADAVEALKQESCQRSELDGMAARLAELETLPVRWESWKDEMRRLVNRLEKVQQRADKKAAEAVEPPTPIDDITQRVLARRQVGNGLRSSADEG